MTVFIAHAQKDASAAEAVTKYLERRGLFVEPETGERGFRFAQARDAVVVLWSRETVFSPFRLQMERRALDAWAEQQLILVKLDHHVAPVGLRDLSAIDAVFEPQREIAWAAVAKTAQDIQMGRVQAPPAPTPRSMAPSTLPGAEAEKPQAPGDAKSLERGEPAKKLERRAAEAAPVAERSGFWPAVGALLAIPAGAFLSLALGLRDPAWPIVGAGLGLSAVWAASKGLETRAVKSAAPPMASAPPAPAPARPAPAPPGPAPAPLPTGVATFISYAHADAAQVIPVVDAVAAAGKPIWIDRDGIQAGEGWAGEIVRAIKAAGGVVVMCSAKAFESDHVRREIYLADKHKKPLLPVFLENAEPPEDFEYFFASVQWLKLFEAPAEDRAALLERAWPKAVSG
jgi:hypothetical protein